MSPIWKTTPSQFTGLIMGGFADMTDFQWRMENDFVSWVNRDSTADMR